MEGRIPAHAGKTSTRLCRRSRASAHPRSRGENRGSGSRSPPTGGRIPAHAGKTPRQACAAASAWAHPRSRGENCYIRAEQQRRAGASPLTRGKLDWISEHKDLLGRIPAHAGKTRDRVRESRPCRAHPRSRGENWCSWLILILFLGASPLTRGKRGLAPDARVCRRRIPAHAGKT